MLNNIKAVIFDLDGTLIDSMWLWNSVDVEYLKQYDITLPDNLQSEIEGMSFTETAHYFKDRFNIPNTIEEIKKEWNNLARYYYTHEVGLKDGVMELLDYLQSNNILMGIGTSNSSELVNLIVSRFKIGSYFASIRTSCEVKKGKPYPDIFLKVAKDLGVSPDECLVFEDIPNGIMAAKAAGMKVCAIEDDFSKSLKTTKFNLSDYFIDSFHELLDDIKEENDDKRLFAN